MFTRRTNPQRLKENKSRVKTCLPSYYADQTDVGVAAGHGAGCGLKLVPGLATPGHSTVAAGHGAGCGLKHATSGEHWRCRELQPVMGPAVD